MYRHINTDKGGNIIFSRAIACGKGGRLPR
jgi:hypothetical protein